jgi:hypothetical protein
MQNNVIFHEKLRRFWRPGDEIICTRIFRHSANNCYLCGNTPIEWHHVLLNTMTNQIIDVEFSCIINIKKIMEKLGSGQKILFFPQYTEEVEHLNSQYPGTAAIVQFSFNPDVMAQLLSKPKELSYVQVKSILNHTVKYNDEFMTELFHAALDIYLERKYYIYDYLYEHEKTGTAEQSIADHLRREWEREMYEEDYNATSYESNVKDDDIPF